MERCLCTASKVSPEVLRQVSLLLIILLSVHLLFFSGLFEFSAPGIMHELKRIIQTIVSRSAMDCHLHRAMLQDLLLIMGMECR